MDAEPTLRVLRVQAEFDLAEAALSVARSTEHHAAAEQQVQRIGQSLELARAEMRRQIGVQHLNPAGYQWVRQLWFGARLQLDAAVAQAQAAADRLDEARTALAQARQRESDLARALADAQRRKRLAQSVREHHTVDDLWLHTHRSPA